MLQSQVHVHSKDRKLDSNPLKITIEDLEF